MLQFSFFTISQGVKNSANRMIKGIDGKSVSPSHKMLEILAMVKEMDIKNEQ